VSLDSIGSNTATPGARSPAVWLALGLIRLYQLTLAPLLPPVCRFHPTCSRYADAAVRRHGALRGGWLALRRLGRCHPWNPGGYDPVV
jgi:putative membrane protein insertion efficiency factor